MFDEYYGSMDRNYGQLAPNDAPQGRDGIVEVSSLTPMEVGTSTNPMENAVTALNARIRHGASKIEIGFMGTGKSNSQRPSPEAFGKQDREDIRALSEINKIRTSVHAALHGDSLAGFDGQSGFNEGQRAMALKEIERAIQFSAEATKGGAIVFHTGEWYRPIASLPGAAGTGFEAFKDEGLSAPRFVVDSNTGKIVNSFRADQELYEAKYLTAKEWQKQQGKSIVGSKDSHGETVEADDWVDLDGNAIKKKWIIDPGKAEKMFDRVPVLKADGKGFEVVKKSFNDYVTLSKEISKDGPETTPEELYTKALLSENIQQLKGMSSYYFQHYEQAKKQFDAAVKAKEYYAKLEKSIPEEELYKIKQKDTQLQSMLAPFGDNAEKLPSEILNKVIEQSKDQLRQIHENVATQDQKIKQAVEQMNRITSVEKYGLEKTGETIGTAGIKAWQYTQMHKKELDEAIFAAPENYDLRNYGSHPDEMRAIIKKSRDKMAEELVGKYGKSKEEAATLAKTHIKATVDIGHFNMWKQHFLGKPNESLENRNKRFDDWAVKELGKLAEEGLIGHIHVADNMGFDDEHLTPGQGNAPIKAFLNKMAKEGIKDFIVEQGSYNIYTALPDTWAMLGSPVYGAGAPTRTWRSFHNQHFGYHNPAQYVVGAYAPSNEWKLWSEVPFE